jgi:CheY-like chemotaxis protein
VTAPRNTVLVIDDDPMIVRALGRLLRSAYEVTTSTRPTEALDKITNGARYDAILCDVMMPELTGMELHHALVLASEGQARRIVFMTGGLTRETQQLLDAVPNLCVAKPFDMPEVLAALRMVISEDRPHDGWLKSPAP